MFHKQKKRKNKAAKHKIQKVKGQKQKHIGKISRTPQRNSRSLQFLRPKKKRLKYSKLIFERSAVVSWRKMSFAVVLNICWLLKAMKAALRYFLRNDKKGNTPQAVAMPPTRRINPAPAYQGCLVSHRHFMTIIFLPCHNYIPAPSTFLLLLLCLNIILGEFRSLAEWLFNNH